MATMTSCMQPACCYEEEAAVGGGLFPSLNAYRSAECLDSDEEDFDDSSSDGYDSDESLDNIYEEIANLQQVVAAQNVAPPPQVHVVSDPRNVARGIFTGHGATVPRIETSIIPGQENSQVVMLKNLPESKPAAPSIDCLIIPENYDVEYDANGSPIAVPHGKAKVNGTLVAASNRCPNSGIDASVVLGGTTQLKIDKPGPLPCPQHGPAGQQKCPVHKRHCQVHSQAAQVGQHGHAHVPQGPACTKHGNNHGHAHGRVGHGHSHAGHVHPHAPGQVHGHTVMAQPGVRRVVTKKKRSKKGMTLFEKLIA